LGQIDGTAFLYLLIWKTVKVGIIGRHGRGAGNIVGRCLIAVTIEPMIQGQKVSISPDHLLKASRRANLLLYAESNSDLPPYWNTVKYRLVSTEKSFVAVLRLEIPRIEV